MFLYLLLRLLRSKGLWLSSWMTMFWRVMVLRARETPSLSQLTDGGRSLHRVRFIARKVSFLRQGLIIDFCSLGVPDALLEVLGDCERSRGCGSPWRRGPFGRIETCKQMNISMFKKNRPIPKISIYANSPWSYKDVCFKTFLSKTNGSSANWRFCRATCFI